MANSQKGCCRLSLDYPRSCSILGDGKLRHQLPDDLGSCYHDFVELELGLEPGHLRYCPAMPFVEETNNLHSGRVMVITLGLKGHSYYQGENVTLLEFKKNYTTIASFQAIPGERHYEANGVIFQLLVVSHESLIYRYIGQERTIEIIGINRLSQLAFRVSTPAAAVHARALLSHLLPFQSKLSRLDLHIHALSLLNEQFNLLAPPHGVPASPFSLEEIERIEQSKKIMSENLDKPLTVNYLATVIGINKNKLRDGIVYLYSCTLTELLLELRMTKAHALLATGQQVS